MLREVLMPFDQNDAYCMLKPVFLHSQGPPLFAKWLRNALLLVLLLSEKSHTVN